MPQPLTHRDFQRRNPKPKFGPETLDGHPLAHYPMSVIARWAYIEMHLAELLTTMLRSDLATGVAMYQALWSGEVRRDAMQAAAKVALDRADYDLFRAVMKCIAASRSRRNDFAHHIWGTAPELPDMLLLMKPDVYVEFRVQIDLYNDPATIIERRIAPRLDMASVFVFKENDFKRDVRDAKKAFELVERLRITLHKSLGSDESRTRLMADANVAAAYAIFAAES